MCGFASMAAGIVWTIATPLIPDAARIALVIVLTLLLPAASLWMHWLAHAASAALASLSLVGLLLLTAVPPDRADVPDYALWEIFAFTGFVLCLTRPADPHEAV